MEILNQVGQLFFSLSLLVILHELGHFIPAKLFKTRVESFYLFFNPWFSIFKKKIGDTTYGIGWLPLGGYVKISGMVDESMDKEQMKHEPQPWEFRSKPAWQRLIIMLGGVTVNALLAIFIYILIMFVYGQKIIPNSSLKEGIWVTNDSIANKIGVKTGDKILKVDGVDCGQDDVSRVLNNLVFSKSMTIERDGKIIEHSFPENFIETLIANKDEGPMFMLRLPFAIGEVSDSSAAKTAGLLDGDEILKADSTNIKYYDQFKTYIESKKGQNVELLILRKGVNKTLTVKVGLNGKIGVAVNFAGEEELLAKNIYEVKNVSYTFAQAIPAGVSETGAMLSLYYKNFMKIFDFKSGAYKGMGGFKAFGKMYSTQWNWEQLWRNTAFISIILAFMNLLPIPALDGGHVMFLTYELITGRKPHEKVMEYAQMAGMILLLGLVLFANINDWI